MPARQKRMLRTTGRPLRPRLSLFRRSAHFAFRINNLPSQAKFGKPTGYALVSFPFLRHWMELRGYAKKGLLPVKLRCQPLNFFVCPGGITCNLRSIKEATEWNERKLPIILRSC